MVAHVISVEASINVGGLVIRIARAHRFLRAGRLIWDRVMMAAERHHHFADEGSGALLFGPAVKTRIRGGHSGCQHLARLGG
jgi:hypothetical protein